MQLTVSGGSRICEKGGGGRESKFPARPEKVAQWGGGTPTHFPPGIFWPGIYIIG